MVEEDGNVERKYEEVLALLQKGIRELNVRWQYWRVVPDSKKGDFCRIVTVGG
jgi:hypothetical protein